jgi:glucokinase
VVTSHQVSGWNGVNLRAWFHERGGGLPVVVANDAHAAGWAEYRRGAGKGTRSFLYSNIGSGIGGAMIVGGRLHDGQGLGAAEFGHTMAPDFSSDSPVALDRLENLCSGWAIEARLHELEYIDPALPLGQLCGGDAGQLTCHDLAAAAKAGDPIALAEVNRVARTVGFAIANAITLIAPEAVAIGGGVSLIGEPLFGPLREVVSEFVFPPYRKTYRIEPAALGEQVVLVGALLMAAEQA